LTLEAVREFSPDVKIFVLIHKIDLIKEEKREIVCAEKIAYIQKLTSPLNMTAFKTSIWDETLYKVLHLATLTFFLHVHGTKMEGFLGHLPDTKERI
jgi:hypothetical protein